MKRKIEIQSSINFQTVKETIEIESTLPIEKIINIDNIVESIANICKKLNEKTYEGYQTRGLTAVKPKEEPKVEVKVVKVKAKMPKVEETKPVTTAPNKEDILEMLEATTVEEEQVKPTVDKEFTLWVERVSKKLGIELMDLIVFVKSKLGKPLKDYTSAMAVKADLVKLVDEIKNNFKKG